jgi:ribosome-binding protein aMBF1 (putative translation factor)
MISSEQIKAGRYMLGWSATELAQRAGVGAATVKRYEMGSGIPNGNVQSLLVLKTTFEAAGIEFTGDPLKNPGVTLNLRG